MKRIALFGDIHGNEPALKKILEDIEQNSYDFVICLGDLLAIGPNPVSCLEQVMNSNITMVLGNHELYHVRGLGIKELEEGGIQHESWVASLLEEKHFEYLRSCPLSKDLLIDGKIFTFTHFPMEDEGKDFPFYPVEITDNGKMADVLRTYDSDYLFFGHDHRSLEYFHGNQHFFCIGSSGCNYSNETFYTIVEIDEKKVSIQKKFLIYDREEFEHQLKTTHYPERERLSYRFFGVTIDGSKEKKVSSFKKTQEKTSKKEEKIEKEKKTNHKKVNDKNSPIEKVK